MGLLSGLKKMLIGNGVPRAPAVAETEQHEHKGFTIETQPTKIDGGFRVSGVIRKDDKEHQFIRADLAYSLKDAHELTLFKAKQSIDQMGERIFS